MGYEATILHHAQANKQLELIAKAKLLFIWRARFPDVREIIEVARSSNVPIIYDIDDLMVRPELATAQYIDAIRFNNFKPEIVAKQYGETLQAMAASDFCTATTAELAWQMRKASNRTATFVLPNGYDHEIYMKSRASARRKPTDGVIRIGYASGSRTHQADFRLCASAVGSALRQFPETKLVLFRRNQTVTLDLNEFPEFEGLEDRIEWRAFVDLRDLPEEVSRFDINLAPLEAGNPFCESKSELKVFEAAICDVPTIASPTGPFSRSMVNGETGFLAKNESEWGGALNLLISDAGLRRNMGRKAHRLALWHWGPTRRAEVLQSIIDQIGGGRAAARAARIAFAEPPASPVPLHEHRIVVDHDRKRPSDVTVIIPLFNYESVVTEALDSVAGQTMQELDLVIVDDASTDRSLERVKTWVAQNHDRFNRLLVVQHVENQGLGASRNTAFDLADTLYVMALDADNRLLPRCCSALFERAKNEAAAFAYSVIQQFGDGNGQMGKKPYRAASLIPANYIDAMAMVSKEAWAYVGGYSEKRRGWQDYEFWCRLADRGLYGLQVNEVLAEYRVHAQSMRSATDGARNKAELVADLEDSYPWLSILDARSGHRTPSD